MAKCDSNRSVLLPGFANIKSPDPSSKGVPHLLTEDDEYNGYFIPKGTIVISSVW